MTKQNNKVFKKVFEEMSGLNSTEISSQSLEDAVMNKVAHYQQQDESGKLALHTMEVTNHEHLKRATLSFFTNEYASIIRSLNMFENIPTSYKRETLRFFSSHFPGFDSGAATALGRFLRDGMKWVQEDAGSSSERWQAEVITNYILKAIRERSRAKYFVQMRKDDIEYAKFSRVLGKYVGMVWEMYMVEEGTYTVDMPLTDRVVNRNKYAKRQAEKFIETTCTVNRDSKVRSDKLYAAYERWADANEVGLIGRGSFVETITELVPTAVQTRLGKVAYINGIRMETA